MMVKIAIFCRTFYVRTYRYAKQKIFKNNIQPDDFALRSVPDIARQWHITSLISVIFGIPTSMYCFLYGAIAVRMFGMHYLLIGLPIITLIAGTIGFILTIVASETGLDIDLISSSSVGYKGACITSLIYGISYIIYFALECNIIATAIHSQFHSIPIWLLYIILDIVFISFTWYGITSINYIMWISLPIFIIGLIYAVHSSYLIPTKFGLSIHKDNINLNNGPIILQMITLFATAIVSSALAITDIGRFIPKKKKILGSFCMSYGVLSCSYLGSTLLGAWLSSKVNNVDPGIYFPLIIGSFGTIIVIISQLRINILNAYSGSLAFSTFFYRFINIAPGRQYWVITLVILSSILIIFNSLEHLVFISSFLAIFLVAWVSVIITDILFNKNLFQITNQDFPIERNELPSYNFVGLAALCVAITIGLILSLGICGTLYITLAPFITALSASLTIIFGKIFSNYFFVE